MSLCILNGFQFDGLDESPKNTSYRKSVSVAKRCIINGLHVLVVQHFSM